jgi:uridine kinase
VAGYVVGISGPSGGGKTTIAKQVAALLGAAVVLHFDDYDNVSVHPADYAAWLAQGADYNAWQLPQLAHDVCLLKQGQAIRSPLDSRLIAPAPYVVFDAPLGRAHQATGQHIDWMVYLDTPLDIALARRLLRDDVGAGVIGIEERLERLAEKLRSYLQGGRAAYLAMDTQIKPLCDQIIDGSLPATQQTQQIVTAVRARAKG